MNELALFAGAGGGILGGKLLGWRTVCAVEIDPYCREVLLRRQEEGFLPPFPIWDDVRTFNGKPWRGKVDVVTAGFPCQPFSVAGKRAGADDERNLWPETLRVLCEVRPRYALLENVPGLISSGYFATILGQLAESGFDAEWGVLGADDVGAPHRRKRLWILAYPHGGGFQVRTQLDSQQTANTTYGHTQGRYAHRRSDDVADAASNRWQPWGTSDATKITRGRKSDRSGVESGNMADADCRGCQRQFFAREDYAAARENAGPCAEHFAGTSWWSVEPDVGRVADGVAFRVDRLRALGNGQVPAVARAAWELLNGR